MTKVFLITLLLITSILSASCGEVNTIHFPGDLLEQEDDTTCKDKFLSPIKDEQGLIDMKLDGQYCLIADLDITTWNEKTWTFKGTFDGSDSKGNRHTITINTIQGNSFIQQIANNATFKNVNINIGNIEPGTTGGNVGALARLNYGTIENVTLTVTNEISSNGNIGGLVAVNEGTINDVTSSGNITFNNSSADNVGGLVGENKGTITNVTSSGNITFETNSKATDVGGLVGENKGTITNVKRSDNITFNNSSADNVGGLVGLNNPAINTTTSISKASVTSGKIDIRSGDVSVGGLVGQTKGGKIEKSYADINIVFGVGSNIRIGGFVGTQGDSGATGGRIENCYSAGQLEINSMVAGNTRLGGFVGHQIKGSISSSYTRNTLTSNNTLPTSIGTTNIVNLGHFGGQVVDNAISNSYYVTIHDEINKELGAGIINNQYNLQKVQVANGKPTSDLTYLNDPSAPAWNIENDQWPTLRENPE